MNSPAPEFAGRRRWTRPRTPVPVAAGHGWKLGDGFRAARAIMKGAEPPWKKEERFRQPCFKETPLGRWLNRERRLARLARTGRPK
jgi:hypothetical protein